MGKHPGKRALKNSADCGRSSAPSAGVKSRKIRFQYANFPSLSANMRTAFGPPEMRFDRGVEQTIVCGAKGIPKFVTILQTAEYFGGSKNVLQTILFECYKC